MSTPQKRDFGTLQTAQILAAAHADFMACKSPSDKAKTLARIILDTFDDYYTRSR
ncbi:MAG: hypothetical protein HN377_06400, partial [Alphaproteobacteria bacterium]|nr:hypothetical protein [Alphaproteobacteria bacterium]